MKTDDIKIGHVYAAKITDQVVPVRIDAVAISLSTGKVGGWDATNLKTNRKVRIKSAQKLRREIKGHAATTTVEPAPEPAKKGPDKKKLSAAERRAKAEPTARDTPAPAKPLSLIDAALRVLADLPKGETMNTKQMIDAITDRGLWSPARGGKTPAASLYSAILRDLKAETARFEKVGRGQFRRAT